MAQNMKPVTLHRGLGLFLGVFIMAHLVNHLALFWGVEQHIALQEMLRKIYRNRFVEPVLIAAFAVQIALGFRLLLRRGWPTRFWPRMQVLSAGLLGFFLIQHIGAALITRATSPEVDTNIYWAASVVSRAPFALYFAPYYVLGLLGLFLHLAAFIALKRRDRHLAGAVALLGTAVSIAIVAALGGGLRAIELPTEYETYLQGLSIWTRM